MPTVKSGGWTACSKESPGCEPRSDGNDIGRSIVTGLLAGLAGF